MCLQQGTNQVGYHRWSGIYVRLLVKKNLVLGPCPQTLSVYCHESLAPWPLESGWLSTLNPRLSRYLSHNCNDHLTNFFGNQFTTLCGDQTNLPPFMLTNILLQRVANKFITIATEINVKKVLIMAQRQQSFSQFFPFQPVQSSSCFIYQVSCI